MAAGDILGVEIGADGWWADITIEGLGTGGTYDLGLGANNTIEGASPKLVFTVTSLGFDDTGAPTTIQRLVYGTKQVRKPYPNEAENQETVVGSDVKVRVALSDYVYAKDKAGAGNSGTDVSVVILSGFYTQASTPNNAFSGAVTNSSTAAYQKVVGNWSWPGYQRMDSSSKLRAVAFERHGQQGKPVRCVKFSVTDGTTTVTQILTAPVYDSTVGDAVPVVEYVSTSDLTSGLTQGAELTCNFIAYPWVGDSGSILDTSAGTAQPTPLYGPIKGVCDNAGTYKRTFAAVSSAGNDTTGIAVDRSAYATDALADAAAVASPCLTIGGAYAKIVAYNLANHSRNDAGAGEIVLTSGTFAWVGAGSAFGVKPKTWPTIRPADGVARADAIVSGQTGGTDLKDLVKLYNVTVGGTAAFMFLNIDSLWFDSCIMSATGTACVNNGVISYWTRNTMAGFVQGILPSTLWTSAPALVRANNLNGFTKGIQTYTVLGNSKTTKDTATIALFIADRGTAGQQGMPIAVNSIVAYNKILGFNCGVAGISWGRVNANAHGSAIVQNVFENWDNIGSSSLADIQGGGLATPINNQIIWHNTFAGERVLAAYNDTGSASLERKFWSEKSNIYDYYAIKSDTFNNVGNGGQDGNRTGNWPEVFGVGASGNLVASLTGFASVDFLKEFSGLSTLQSSSLQANDYVKYTDDKAWKGGADTNGLGDYTLQPTSPAIGLPIDWLLPYDLAGSARTEGDAAGAYTYADPVVPSSGNNNNWKWWIMRRR